jgi:hypothetical protein
VLVAVFAGGDGPLQAKPPKARPNEDHPHSRDVLAKGVRKPYGDCHPYRDKTCATVRVLTNVPKAKTSIPASVHGPGRGLRYGGE